MTDKRDLDQHLEYSAWATNRLLEVVVELSEEDLQRDFKTSDRTIVGTLAHVFAADRIWLDRVLGRRREKFIEDKDRDLRWLRENWPGIHKGWHQWLAAHTVDLNAPVSYTDLQGNSQNSLPGEIILHVVNHGTHHRGQVSGFLRMLGQTPPPLDLIRFYRSR